MAPHIIRRRGRALGRAQDGDIGVVVADPDRDFLAALHDVLLEIDSGLVDLVIVAMTAIGGLDVLHALHRRGRFRQRIVGGFASGLHLEEQHRLVADCLHAVLQPLGHLDQKVLGGDERLLTFDGHFHLARLHHPEDAIIGIELGLGLFAGRHLDPVAFIVAAEEDFLRPAGLALVRRQHISQAIDQLVGSGIGRKPGRLGSPGDGRLAGGRCGLCLGLCPSLIAQAYRHGRRERQCQMSHVSPPFIVLHTA